MAQTKGYFTKRNLDVELINFGGSTDQLLEAIATGKADAGVGMALRWLKPLEQGFDVRITAATTAAACGCLTIRRSRRHHARRPQGQDHRRLRPGRAGQELLLHPAGEARPRSAQPTSTGSVIPADLLPVALQKGEVQAFTLGDPLGWVIRDRDGLTRGAPPTSTANTRIAPAACWACAAA